jgi:mannitol/fructose-specific phosphotransferase system IIA component (Ntr-type)
MPYRPLTLAQAADRLHLTVQDVAQLVKYQEIPFTRRGEEPVFFRRELDAWASQRLLGLGAHHVASVHRSSSARRLQPNGHERLIPRLFLADWIEPDLHSRTKPSVLRDMVRLALRTDLLYDEKAFLRGLEEREQLCSTAMDHGVAFLHTRDHDPHLCGESFVVLGRTRHPIFAGAADGGTTDLFFLLCCQDDALHLHVLARLCAMVHGTPVLEGLRQAETATEMLALLIRNEETVLHELGAGMKR